jgi:DNA-binding MarR family transcriptional regulator
MTGNGEWVETGAFEGVTWAVRRAAMAVLAFTDHRLRAMDMAPSHYSLLVTIDAEPGRSAAEAARRLNVTPQAVASLAAKLEDRDLVERRPHPRHRHVQELHLTDAGRDALRSAKAAVEVLEQRICRELGPEDTSRLIALLNRAADTTKDAAVADAGGAA